MKLFSTWNYLAHAISFLTLCAESLLLKIITKYLTQWLCTYSNVGADPPQLCSHWASLCVRPGVIPHSLSSSGIKLIFTTIKLYLIQPFVYFQRTIGQQEIQSITENIVYLKAPLCRRKKSCVYIFYTFTGKSHHKVYSVNDNSTLLLCYNGYSRYTVIKYKINSRCQKLFQKLFPPVHENKLLSVSSWILISSFMGGVVDTSFGGDSNCICIEWSCLDIFSGDGSNDTNVSPVILFPKLFIFLL